MMPYTAPVVFGRKRHSDEPIAPLTRYAMYPRGYEENVFYWKKGKFKGTLVGPRPVPAVLRKSLPIEAQAALKAAADYAAAWLQEGTELSKVLSTLTQNPESLSEERMVTVNGRVIGRATPGVETRELQLHITSLAQQQLNVSYDLMPSAPTVISPGTHWFMLQSELAGMSTLQATISSNDTNADVLERLLTAFNQEGLGLIASIQEVPGSSAVRLVLQSRLMGPPHGFKLEDIGSGSIVRALGIDRTEQPPTHAVYSIDGDDTMVSSSNDISLQNGAIVIALDQLGASNTVTVEVGHDHAELAARLILFATHVNALAAIFENALGSLNPMLMEGIEGALNHPGIKAVGLQRSPDGTWKLNEAQLQAFMNADPEGARWLVGERSGFAFALNEELNRLAVLPTKAFINDKARVFNAFTRYNAAFELYLQLRLSGFRVDFTF